MLACREHVAQLREREKEFAPRGVRIAAIGLGDRNYPGGDRHYISPAYR